MSELTKLPNIGKILVQDIESIGIKTPTQLKEMGSKKVFMMLKLNNPTSCYNKLCALEGAVQGIRWHNLSNDTKKDLKAFLASL